METSLQEQVEVICDRYRADLRRVERRIVQIQHTLGDLRAQLKRLENDPDTRPEQITGTKLDIESYERGLQSYLGEERVLQEVLRNPETIKDGMGQPFADSIQRHMTEVNYQIDCISVDFDLLRFWERGNLIATDETREWLQHVRQKLDKLEVEIFYPDSIRITEV